MRKLILLLLVMSGSVYAAGQSRGDSAVARAATGDTAMIHRFINQSLDSRKTNMSRAVDYALMALQSARGMGYDEGQRQALASLVYLETQKGNHTKAAEWYRALRELDGNTAAADGASIDPAPETASANETAVLKRPAPAATTIQPVPTTPAPRPQPAPAAKPRVLTDSIKKQQDSSITTQPLPIPEVKPAPPPAQPSLQYGYWAMIVVLLLAAATVIYLLRRNRRTAPPPAAQPLDEAGVMALMEAEEARRRALTTQVQDKMGQLMSAMKMNLSALSDTLRPAAQREKETLDKTMQLVEASFEQVKNISAISLPVSLETEGLPFATDALLRATAQPHQQVNLYADGWDERPALAIEQQLYRMIAAVVQVSVKRTAVQQLNVTMLKEAGEISITIEDDGSGALTAEMEQLLKEADARAAMLGGVVETDISGERGMLVMMHVGR